MTFKGVLYGGILSMDFDVVFNPELNIVSVRAIGEIDHENGALIVENILKVAAKHDCNKLFCDYSISKVKLSLDEIYETPQLFDLWGIPQNFMIAILYSEDEKKFKYGETRLHNSGFAVRIFRIKDEALTWLIN